MKRLRNIIISGTFAALFAVSPSGATVVDLTVAGNCTPITAANIASCSIGAAVFTQAFEQSTGTGVIDPFNRIQPTPPTDIEQGMNTDANGVYDNKADPFTHSIKVGDFGTVNLLGVQYIRFLLDIHEDQASPDGFLDLDRLKIVTVDPGVAGANTMTTIENATAATGPTIYEMNAGNTSGPSIVKLNTLINPGSGAGDMFMYIPASLFAGTAANYLYLYSEFGNVNAVAPGDPGPGYDSSATFEEWARVLSDSGTPVPEPSQLLSLFVVGVPVVFGYLRKRRAAQAA